MTTKHLVRFFLVTPPVMPMMLAAFAATTLFGAIVLILDADRGSNVATPLLLLQLFASSSGFGGPARRGYYDLLLTSGASRLHVAVVHWMMSTGPGIVCWMAVALVERAATNGAGPSVLSSGTCAAMLLLSTIPWAVSVALPRFTAAVGWLLIAAMAAMVMPAGGLDRWLQTLPAGRRAVTSAVWFLVYPLGAAGHRLSASEWMVVLPGVLVAVGALAAAWRWVAWADYPLEASQ